MIADILSNKKLNLIVTELLIRGRKLNMSLVFITQSYFSVPINIKLNSAHHFIIEIPNKREIYQILTIKIKECLQKITAKPYSFFSY